MVHYQEFSEINASEGLQTLFIYVNDVTDGLFINLFLFALFLITMFGSFFSSKRLTGKGDMSISFAVAGYFTSGLALILSLITGMINIFTIIIVIGIAIIGTIWLWLSKTTE